MLGAFAAVLSSLVAATQPALGFDFFGLFGSRDEPPPAESVDAIVYDVEFVGVDDRDLLRALRDASTLYRLRDDPSPDPESVVRRAEADVTRLTDALWAYGYYDGLVSIFVDGVRISPDGVLTPLAARLERYRRRAPVPVRIVVETGTLYRILDVAVEDARTDAPFPPQVLPPRIVQLKEGDPARSADVLAAQARIVDRFRALGHPFAEVTTRDPVVDHRLKTMTVAFEVAPGPLAGIGPVTIRGAENVDPAVIRSFIYTAPGDPYSPQVLSDMRRSVGRIEALGSVRVREADALDAYGNLPLVVDVTERPPRLFGFGLRYSTADGPGARVYWAHRNLFGGAERLRLEADVFYTENDRIDPITGRRDEGWDWSDLGGRFTASFLKPALGGTRNDLLVDAQALREVTEGYTTRLAGATAAIRHRFSDTFSVNAGIQFERGQTSDVLGQIDYRLVGLPLAVAYDSTDSLLDPTEGIRFTGSVTPYLAALGSDPGITRIESQASTYYSLDEENRYILAGRIGFGSMFGAALDEIPANRRFFAGGGGSVRGFEYRTLGPRGPFDEPIGGRSLLDGSIEARIKVTDVIGIVPFVDAGTAFESVVPDFDESIRVAAGIGLRYYTGIGPIRVDVAFPLDRRRGENTAALYISLGQAF